MRSLNTSGRQIPQVLEIDDSVDEKDRYQDTEAVHESIGTEKDFTSVQFEDLGEENR